MKTSPYRSSVRFLFLLLFGLAGWVAGDNLQDMQKDAVTFYQAGRYEAAIPLYRKIAEAHPKNPGAMKDFLIALWLGDHFQEAAEVGARLTRLSTHDVDAEFIYARALLATGQKEAALAAFRRCRELDPKEEHIQLAAARVEGMLREYDNALTHMVALKKRYPDYQELYPELAHVQQITGRFAAAAENWSKAAAYFPENHVYAFHQAECFYYSEQRDAAIKMLVAQSSSEPPYWPAIDFLTDIYIAGNDATAARALLEAHLQTPHADDAGRLLKLIHLDQRESRWDRLIADADRWLALAPQNGTALTFKADALQNEGHYKKAIALYQEILRLNPSATGALRSLAKAQNADGHPALAVQTIKRAIVLDPTDPYLLIFESYYLYESGDHKNPKAILEEWISSHPDPALPAILYHGVTPTPQDPILAYAVHRTTATLEEHLRALRDARYTPVTAEEANAWITGKGSLPEHPILITFDDARLDSFQNTDPLLKAYGMKATMFAPLVEVEGYIPKFASWKDLRSYQNTGRWEIQSHGDHAHELVPTDAEGRRGLFLLNKQWLIVPHRLETVQEWGARAGGDYDKSRSKIETQLGKAPHAYAFPEGNFGQEGVSNSTQAAAFNLAWAAHAYGTAYHEDDYGFNIRQRDPMHLTRYESPANETGKTLLRHLTDDAPAILMIRRLLRQALWDERTHEAEHWLAELKTRGASASCLWAEEARVRYARGDVEAARSLAEKALADDDSAENRELVEMAKASAPSSWKGRFAYQEDNRNRISRRFRQDLGFWHAGGLDWSLHHLFGTYSERGVPTVTQHGGGVGVARNLGDVHRLSMEATGHALNASAKDTYSLTGALHSGWTENLDTDLEGGRDIYDTARALNANVINHFVSALVNVRPATDWRASARTRLEDLSDDNKRATGILEGAHRMLLPKLWLVARATLDTTQHVSPNYYSPQVLQEYQLGLDYTLPLTKESTLNVAYMPGYGKEKTSDGEFVNDIDVTLNLALTHSLMLIPAVYLIRQPTYHRNTYSASLAYRF